MLGNQLKNYAKKTIMVKAIIIRRVAFECDKVELSYWFDEGWGNGVSQLSQEYAD
jgi:hypothetical protein